MLTEQAATLPDADAIKRDLEYMTARWSELSQPAVFEIRAFKEGASPQTAKFSPDWIDEAVDWAENMNGLGFNIYAVRNPIRADVTGSAKDEDIVGAFFLWADCDDPASAGNVHRFDGPKWSAAVVTGTVPAVRVHTYWQLETPCTDMTEWRAMQETIAAHFGSDRTVVNPSRIMRVGGTVAYPAKHKQDRGYVKELTTIRTQYEEERRPVTPDQMRRVFGATAPAQKPADGFKVDLGPQPLDRERTAIQALSGQEWNSAVLRLVGSYVRKGLSDAEIHALTDPLTLSGYTVQDTREEVQDMIDRTRANPKFEGAGQVEEPNHFVEMSDEEKAEVKAFDFKPWGHRDLAAIPYPEFVYSDFYARGYTSLTLAPPKVGKSMLGLAEAIDMATGRGILTGQERDPLRVVYYNAEDDQNVLDSRVAALLTKYDIEQDEIAKTLFPVSGVEHDDFFMISGQDGIINEPLFVSLEKFIIEQNADVLIFDPLQDLSHSPETNEVFRFLGQRLRRLASVTGVALGLIHHTRKIAPGAVATIDDGRGGSALRGTARFNRLLISMTEDEAAKAGVENHRHFMRIGDMESNLAPPSSDVNRWFQKVSVVIPNGHSVGAIEPWEWPDAFSGVSVHDARKVQVAVAAMEDEPPLESNRSPQRWIGVVVADVLGLDLEDKAVKARVGVMVKTWIKTGVLEVVEIRDSRAGRDRRAVICGPNNPMATETVK